MTTRECDVASLPYTKLLDAVEAQLNALSERAIRLESEIGQSLITAGLLSAGTVLLYFAADGGVAAIAAVLTLYAARNLPANISVKRQTIADIAAFEDRLSERNVGVKWEDRRSMGRMSVRAFWRH